MAKPRRKRNLSRVMELAYCERINSQAKELGIERPKVRNGRSVANLNTLTYLVINVRALQRARALNAELLSNSKGVLQMI